MNKLLETCHFVNTTHDIDNDVVLWCNQVPLHGVGAHMDQRRNHGYPRIAVAGKCGT